MTFRLDDGYKAVADRFASALQLIINPALASGAAATALEAVAGCEDMHVDEEERSRSVYGARALEGGRPWRAAACLLKLRNQVNAMAPSRLKKSDGIVGDADHQTRDSDHNPWVEDGG